jgi:3-deoxy-D-manno-octulosonate 8-phosphate phosphatase KdsC-like HAD superfamily phosphatase
MSHYDKERESYQDFIKLKAKEVQGIVFVEGSEIATAIFTVENPSPLELRVKELEERIKELEKKQG